MGTATTQSGLGYAGLFSPNLFTTPEKAQQIRTEVPKLGGTAFAYATPQFIKGAKSVGKIVGSARDASLISSGVEHWVNAV